MAGGDTYVFPGFPTPVPSQLFFPKPPTTFLKFFCRGESQKYARDQTHNHQATSLTRSPLSHPVKFRINTVEHVQAVLIQLSLLNTPTQLCLGHYGIYSLTFVQTA